MVEAEVAMAICRECGEECTVHEVTFDYAGSHCTHGRPGTHHTGIWESDCCDAEFDAFITVDKPRDDFAGLDDE